MIKHVNFTGRRRVPRDRVQVEVHDGQPRSFDAQIDLTETRLPAGAAVYLEAMCAGSTDVERFAFGTVDRIVPPADRTLKKLEGEHVFFALKVVDQTERLGRILGIAENIRPYKAGKQTSTGRKGILPIDEEPLGQCVWRLSFGEHDVCLIVNSAIPELKKRARWDPLFYAAVYPAVIRQILDRALQMNAEIDEADDRWPSTWLRFGRDLHPERSEPPPANSPEDDRDEWVEEIIAAFCDSHKLKDEFARALSQLGGGEE
jgi:hypothetical protein